VALLALVIAMAIPPPERFINVEKARIVDQHFIEVSFDWPRCADPAYIAADWAGATQEKDGWDVRFALEEARGHHDACTGPSEKQTRRFDLRQVLRKDMTHGKLRINDESLYGYMKKLPSFTVDFDLR
jgi:hypothetical protein